MPTVKDISIFLGPPGPEEEKRKIQTWASNSGKAADQIWVEYVHDVLRSLSVRGPNGEPSHVDELFSRLLHEDTRVNDLFLTYMFHKGAQHPGVIIQTNKIVNMDGVPLRVNWADPELKQTIESIFGYLLKTEWVRTILAYE